MFNVRFAQSYNSYFQGIAVMKHSSGIAYLGRTTEMDDDSLLSLVETVLQTCKSNSFSSAHSSVAYRLPNNVLFVISYLENGIGVCISSPRIQDIRGGGPEPYMYLTHDTVLPSLRRRLENAQVLICEKLGRNLGEDSINRELMAAFRDTVRVQQVEIAKATNG